MKGIAGKLVGCMRDISFVKNDARNKEQNYNYASDEAVLSEVKKAMVKNNVASFVKFVILSNVEGKNHNGKVFNKIEMECLLVVVDADSGETLESNGFGAGIDYGGDKALMKAQTVCHKYALMKLFCMPTGDNPEADEQVDREAKQSQNNQAAKQNNQKAATPQSDIASADQRMEMFNIAKELGIMDQVGAEIKERYGVSSSKDLKAAQAAEYIKDLLGRLDVKNEG